MPTCWCCLYLFIFPALWQKWCWLSSFCKSAVILDVFYLLLIFICYLWWNIYCFLATASVFLFFRFVGLNGKEQGRARHKTNKRERERVTESLQEVKSFSNWTMRMMMSQQWCHRGLSRRPLWVCVCWHIKLFALYSFQMWNWSKPCGSTRLFIYFNEETDFTGVCFFLEDIRRCFIFCLFYLLL